YSSYIKPLHPSFPPSERLSTLPRQTVKPPTTQHPYPSVSSWLCSCFGGRGHAVG
ncbi:hypothetical protein QBC32DRAFT_200934, partial [Pseudoneurospora amorphoporcata]